LNQTAVLHEVKAWYEKQEHLKKQLQDLQNEKKKLIEQEQKLNQEVNELKSRKLSQELSWEHLNELPALIAASKKALEQKE
jgi:predicted nuclease with TOPRIM domain